MPANRPMMTEVLNGNGDIPSQDLAFGLADRSLRTHQMPHGTSTSAAAIKRTKPMSNGVSVLCAIARATTMNDTQMPTVMIAAAIPIVCFEKAMHRLWRGLPGQ